MKKQINITNFLKYSSFFHITKYINFIDANKSKKFLLPNEQELIIFDKEIQNFEKTVKMNLNQKA